MVSEGVQSEVVELNVLGRFELRRDGAARAIRFRKAEAVLAVLALSEECTVDRDKLCGLLWPDVPDVQARHSLRQTLLNLRKDMRDTESELLDASARSVRLNRERVNVDVLRFEALLEEGTCDALREAT